jgi:hypothetical protein
MIKNLKFLSLTLLFALAFSSGINAQKLSFSEKINSNGDPLNAATTFAVGKNGGVVYIHFVLPANFNGAQVNFDVYRLEAGGKEVFQSTMKQPVTAGKSTVSKQMTFYDAGQYRIYVFNEKDQQLGSGTLTIKQSTN